MATNDKRSYSEEEVGKLISRAITRQEADRSQKKDHEGGLSLEEVQQVARDAGIDPHYITLAVADLERGEPLQEKGRFFGTPSRIRREVLMQGHLSPDDVGDLVSQIRAVLAPDQLILGRHEMIGKTFEWSTPALGSARSILIRGVPEGEHTRLTYQEDQSGLIVLFHLWWMIMMPMSALFLLVGLPIAPLILFVLSLVSYFGGWFITRKIHDKRVHEAETLLDKLKGIAESNPEPDLITSTDQDMAPAARPRLDIPEPDPLAESSSKKKRATRRS